ncbi:hypothetical protein VN24_20250 [Paenibacillus beijingensis]|uniref:Citrate transporter-like domain-containing protein n=1 Tax=Paenibacillus beijingensis TaxID=1126833 RepID=A0A0D5NRV1_9BACL|nr:hypothetical protein VN24_20250 [Paenibacillus beijingensis]
MAAYLSDAVYSAPWLKWLISVLSLLIVLTVFSAVKPYVRFLGSLFLALGLVMLIRDNSSLPAIVLSFGSMLNVLSLFALIPLIALPIELGGYAVKLRSMIQRSVHYSGVLYLITSSLAYILSSFMNLAALPMVYGMIGPSLALYPIRLKERFVSRAITHGYAMPIIWSPVAPIMGIVIEMTGAEWGSLLPIVVPLSLLGLTLDWVMGLLIARHRIKKLDPSAVAELSAAREESAGADDRRSGADKPRHPLQIVAALIVFNGLIALLEWYSHLSFLLLVSLIVIPFAFAWSLLIGKGGSFFKEGRRRLPQQLVNMQDQFFVYLSAGFMITAIKTTGGGEVINMWLGHLKGWIGSDLFLLFIPLIPLALAFAGLHPAVGLALVAESLDPQKLGISVNLTAIAMLAGASSAFMMGPYNATAGLMANLVKRSPYSVSNWNAPYTAAYLGLSMIFLIILKKIS